MQKQLEKNQEIKKEQKKVEAKKKEKVDAEKALEEKRNCEEGSIFKFTVTGADIKTLTQQIISKMSAISSGTSDRTSVDVLV